MEQNAFSAGIFAQVTGTASDEATAQADDVRIFIHGYNVSFADAAVRAAQFAYDIYFPGVPLLYSWPSIDEPPPYLADINNAHWSARHFVDLIDLLRDKISAGRIHIAAHSMGSQLLLDALERLRLDDGQRLGQVIFVAPDVDTGIFEQTAPAILQHTTRCTVHWSERDKALRLSQWLSRNPRLGRGGTTATGIDSIDATSLAGDPLGHSVFASNALLLGPTPRRLAYLRTRSATNADLHTPFTARSTSEVTISAATYFLRPRHLTSMWRGRTNSQCPHPGFTKAQTEGTLVR